MKRPPPRFTRTDTLFPYTTLFRSVPAQVRALVQGKDHLGSTTVPLPRIAFQFEWSMCLQPARRRGRPEGRGHPDLSGPRKIRTRLGVDGAEGRRSRKASKLRLHGRHALDLREGSYSRLGLL